MDWKRIFDAIGLNGTWWQWRIHRLGERLDAIRSGAATRGEQIAYQHRLCDRCGGLIDRDTTICPRCGEELRHWRTAQWQRAAGLLMPMGPNVTVLLVVANILVLFVQAVLFGIGGAIMGDGQASYVMGALMTELVAYGQPWRVITYAYLHGNLLHILFNLASLQQLGPLTEREIGRARFFVVYSLGALGGAIADVVWARYTGVARHAVGASGAIFGLIGFGLTFNYFYGGASGRRDSRIYLQWAIYSFAFGLVLDVVDNVCHTGGFIAGALMGFLVERDLRSGDRLRWLWLLLSALLALGTLVAFGLVISAART